MVVVVKFLTASGILAQARVAGCVGVVEGSIYFVHRGGASSSGDSVKRGLCNHLPTFGPAVTAGPNIVIWGWFLASVAIFSVKLS